jgi:hypothetical protein
MCRHEALYRPRRSCDRDSSNPTATIAEFPGVKVSPAEVLLALSTLGCTMRAALESAHAIGDCVQRALT